MRRYLLVHIHSLYQEFIDRTENINVTQAQSDKQTDFVGGEATYIKF